MHPKGDTYYYHKEWCLITPDDITQDQVCAEVEAAHEDFLTYLPDGIIPSPFESRLFDVNPVDARQDVVSHLTGHMYQGLSSGQCNQDSVNRALLTDLQASQEYGEIFTGFIWSSIRCT